MLLRHEVVSPLVNDRVVFLVVVDISTSIIKWRFTAEVVYIMLLLRLLHVLFLLASLDSFLFTLWRLVTVANNHVVAPVAGAKSFLLS